MVNDSISVQKIARPGDGSHEERIARMLRVNHAGEYGARRIYAGQMAVLKNDECLPVLQHMYEQEEEHFQVFDEMIKERQVRPTVMQPLWHIAGFALGAGTAMISKEAAMACTVAVEEAIDEHYTEQLENLGPEDAELKAYIERFREEELEHRDTGIAQGAENAPAYGLLYNAVRAGSKAAIWLSTRI